MADLAFAVIVLLALLSLALAGWVAWRLFFKGGRLRGEPRPVVEVAAVAPPPAQARAGELVRVERDPAGQTVVWLDGRRVERINEIADDQLRTAVRLLLSALKSAPATVQPAEPESAAAQPPAVAPVRVEGVAAAAEPSAAPLLDDTEFDRPFLTRLRESIARPQRYAPPKMPAPPRAKRRKDEPEPVWLFARLNEILQKKLREQPGLPETEISGDDAELRIVMDDLTYTSVDSVPDERVRAVIRSAVAEWERS